MVIEKDSDGHVTYTAVTAPSAAFDQSTAQESSSNVDLDLSPSVDESESHGNISSVGERPAIDSSNQHCCSEGQCNR